MAFCQSCGAGLRDGVRFCPACGADTGGAPPETSPRKGTADGPALTEASTGVPAGVPAGSSAGASASPSANPASGGRRRVTIVVALLGALLVASILAGVAFHRHLHGSDAQHAARQGIDAFAGKPTPVTYRATAAYIGGHLLRFTQKDGAAQVDYYVDAATHRVMRMDDFNHPAYHVALGLSAAQQTALAFARRHFPGFDGAGLTLTERRLIDSGPGTAKYFSFVWIKKDAASGALLPVAVSVRVDPVKNAVFSYDSLNAAVGVDTTPRITSAAAGTTALSAAEGAVPHAKVKQATLAVSTDPPDDPAGRQALVWQVLVQGSEQAGSVTGAYVYVDARSGKVLGVDSLQ